MINILFNGCKIPANENGTPLEILDYWLADPAQTILRGIAQAFADGQWEPVPEPTPLPPEPNPATPEPVPQPQWTAFNTAMLTDPYWQSWSIPHDLRVAIISSAIGANTDAFQTAYDLGASIVPPSTEAINNWQIMAETFNIPITFNPF